MHLRSQGVATSPGHHASRIVGVDAPLVDGGELAEVCHTKDGWTADGVMVGAELGPVRDVLTAPLHPYTDGLMGSTPLASRGKARLHQIPGAMPRLDALPAGCAFSPRCPRVQDKCRVDPGPHIEDGAGRAACFFPLSREEVA